MTHRRNCSVVGRRLHNAWYRIRYWCYAPFYDTLVTFAAERQESIRLLGITRTDKALLVGIGTGLDVPFLPPCAMIVGVDLTPAMLTRARPRGRDLDLALMDAHALGLVSGVFDVVILHHVLEVFHDPSECLREVARVLRSGGRVAVFDKFVPAGVELGWPKRLGLTLMDLVYTSTKMTLAGMLGSVDNQFELERDESAHRHYYRYVGLRRK